MSLACHGRVSTPASRRAGLSTPHPQSRAVLVRASSELKRPELKRPDLPPQSQSEPRKLFKDDEKIEPTIASSSKQTVTVEYQRQRAKEMTKYFQNSKLQEQVQKSKVFGWTPANEINNGRWVMFGFAVGMLTEYATGVSFTEQLALMVNYLGIADLD